MKTRYKNFLFLFLVIIFSSGFLYGCATVNNTPKYVSSAYCPKGYYLHRHLGSNGFNDYTCLKKSISVCNFNKNIPGFYMVSYFNNLCNLVVSASKCPHGYSYNNNALSKNDVCVVAKKIKCIYGYPTGRENIEKFPERCLNSNKNKVVNGANYICKQGPLAVSSNSNLWKVVCKAKTHPICPAGFSHFSLFGGGTCVKRFAPQNKCPSGYKAYVGNDLNIDGKCVKTAKPFCPKGLVKESGGCYKR